MAFVVIIVLSTAVRLPGCFSGFWLDERLTYFIAEGADSPVDIFTRVLYDNNHHLNTLILYFIGANEHWVFYRIHSLLSGVGKVVLAWSRRLSVTLPATFTVCPGCCLTMVYPAGTGLFIGGRSDRLF